ncbi:CDGSH iron-sulfur domain-containing protein 2, partial [Galemys pyrenaicus]
GALGKATRPQSAPEADASADVTGPDTHSAPEHARDFGSSDSVPAGLGACTQKRPSAEARWKSQTPNMGTLPRAGAVAAAAELRGRAGDAAARMVLESVARIVKVQLPAYLKRLPVPESITGFARLTVAEWLRLLPFLGVLALLGYLAVRPFLPKKKQQKDSLINLKIQKENPKVVNEINIEDLCLTKAAYCRCWRSKTFPACDGSHNKHNELTGDNVGPLILKKKEV